MDDGLHEAARAVERRRGGQALGCANPTTVVAHLNHRSVEMNSLWIYILPKHVWQAADTKSWEKFSPPLPLVGSGPYTVTRWNPNGTTVLERNPYFRRANTGPERVLMTYYGDGNGAVTDLEQNRLDVMPSDTLDVPDATRLQRTTGVRVYRSPADRPRVLGLQPGPQRDLARAQERDSGPGDPHRAGLVDGPREARPGLALRIRGARQHAAFAQLRALHARPLERPQAGLPLRSRARPPHPRSGGLEGRARTASGQPERRSRELRARLRRRRVREARRRRSCAPGRATSASTSTCASTTPTS